MRLGLMHWDSVEGSEDSWVMDSGASFHAMHSGETMVNLKEGNFGKIRLANDHILCVTGMGDVNLVTPLGKWKVINGNLVIARGKKRGSLYMAKVSAEGVTIPVKQDKVWFAESKGQKRVRIARAKPGAKVIQAERDRRFKLDQEFSDSGSMGRVPGKVRKLRWVLKTGIPIDKISPGKHLLNLESGFDSRCISGSGGSCKPVEIENESVTVSVTAGSGKTDELRLSGSFNEPSGN
jgi:hypothetical protein